MCPGPRARGSTAVVWSPPAAPPPRAGGPSAIGHALDTGSHRPHVRHPPPEDAPILSSLRPKPFCCPLLAAERHVKLPASLLSVQRSAVFAAQPSMSNGGEQASGLWTRACFDFPTQQPRSRRRPLSSVSTSMPPAASGRPLGLTSPPRALPRPRAPRRPTNLHRRPPGGTPHRRPT
jgi:hypothetical protein